VAPGCLLSVMQYLSTSDIEKRLSYILESPKDQGALKMIVSRPKTNERRILDSSLISQERGVEGDNWSIGCWKSLPNGAPHPDVQITITNYRVLEVLAECDEKRALAGDNLYVDLDLSDRNLQTGDCLRIGDAVIEITSVPHNGCAKYKQRFGSDALAYVNSPRGKELHLRGIYAKVVRDGIIRSGDTIEKSDCPTSERS